MSLINDYENSVDPRTNSRVQVPRVNVASATPATAAPVDSIEFGQPLPGSVGSADAAPELIPYDTTPYDETGEEILPGVPLPEEMGAPTTNEILHDYEQQAINIQRQRLESLHEPILYNAPEWGTTPIFSNYPTSGGSTDPLLNLRVPEGRSMRQLMESTPGGQRAPQFGNPLGNVGQSEPGQGTPGAVPSLTDVLLGVAGVPENIANSIENLAGAIPGVGGFLRQTSQALNPWNWGQYAVARSQGLNHEQAWSYARDRMTPAGEATDRITGQGVLDGSGYGGGALGTVFRGLDFVGNTVRGVSIDLNAQRNENFTAIREGRAPHNMGTSGLQRAVSGQAQFSYMNPEATHSRAEPQSPAIPNNPLANLPDTWWGTLGRIGGGFVLDALSEGGVGVIADIAQRTTQRAATRAAGEATNNALNQTATEAQEAAINQRIALAEQRQAQRRAQQVAETNAQIRAANNRINQRVTNIPGQPRQPANAAEASIAAQLNQQATRGEIVRVVPGNLAQGQPEVTIINARPIDDTDTLFSNPLNIERAQLPGNVHTLTQPALPGQVRPSGMMLMLPASPTNVGRIGEVLDPSVRMLPAAGVENARIAGFLPPAPEMTPRVPAVVVPDELPLEIVSRRVPSATEQTLTEANAIYRQRLDLEIDSGAFNQIQHQFQELQAQRKIDTTMLRDYVDSVADDLGQGTYGTGTIYDNILNEIEARYPRTVRNTIDETISRGVEPTAPGFPAGNLLKGDGLPTAPTPERISQYANELAAERGTPVDQNILEEAGTLLNDAYAEDLAIFRRGQEDDLLAAELAAQPDIGGGVRVFAGTKAQLPDGTVRSLVQAGTTRGDLGNGMVLYRNADAAREAADALPNKNVIYGELDVNDDGKLLEVQGTFAKGVDADAPLLGEQLSAARDAAKKLLPVMAYMDFKDSLSGLNLRQLYELFDEQAARFGVDKERLGFVFRDEMSRRFKADGYDHVFDADGRLLSLVDTNINELEVRPWRGDIDGYANTHNLNAKVKTKQTFAEAIRNRINYNDAVRQRLELRGRELKDTIMTQLEQVSRREGELRFRNFQEMYQRTISEMKVAREESSYRVLEDIDTLDESLYCL